MKAVIMAGGEGTRLRPLTSNTPKPLAPVVNRPMMAHVIDLLVAHGIDDVIVTVAYLANAIQNYFGDGSQFGVRLTYATEDTPLGTAGSVRNAAEHLDERFLVVSGDVLTDIDLSALVAEHEAKSALATIGLVAVENPLEFGIVISRPDGSIERFLEKPGWGQVFSDTINTGIFVLEPEIFDFIAPDAVVDFSGEVFPALMESGQPLFGAVGKGYWEDVGTLEAYLRAHRDVLDGRVQVRVDGFEVSEGVWIGEGAEIHPDAQIEGPVVVGSNCRVEAGVQLGAYSVLGANVKVRGDARLDRVVVHDNVYVGPQVTMNGTIVGRGGDLRRGARIEEGVVLGENCYVGEGATINAGVKVFPFKTIEAGATVNTSIVWETRGARSLFSALGVSGLANVDITPEFASAVAEAYGSTLKSGSTVAVSRDSSRAARMLKRATIAGLNASGISVLDLEMASIPVTRFTAARPFPSGGITVRLDDDDPQSVVIRFLDPDGRDLDEAAQRKIERLYARGDARHVLANEIGDIDLPPRALEHYANALNETVQLSVIRARAYKIVVDYAFGATAFAMPNVLSKLNASVLAVNPYASTPGVMSWQRHEAIEAVGALVRASGSDLGVVISPSGEQVAFVDDTGAAVSDRSALLALCLLVTANIDGDQVAVPVTASARVEDLVEGEGLSVLRTKESTSALMEAAMLPRVGFAADARGGFILPGFLPAFDGAATMVKLLELLALAGQAMSEVCASLPEVHQAHRLIATPWERKGAVMRQLVERTTGRNVDLLDGVKVFLDEGWVLALPDPALPITHLWVDAASAREADLLAEEYERRIARMI